MCTYLGISSHLSDNDIKESNIINNELIFLEGYLWDKGISEKMFKHAINIAKKNSFYGEYTFHYNMWKNNLIKKNDKNWIGFCTYRRFWVKKKKIISTYKELEENILKFVPQQWDGYESILASPIKIKKIKKIKIIKNAFIEIIKNPYLFFKTKQNIKDHFYIFHGSNFLDESIKLLKFNEKKEFINFLNKDSFNPHNLFFCKNLSIKS
jgi:hypothetical protein